MNSGLNEEKSVIPSIKCVDKVKQSLYQIEKGAHLNAFLSIFKEDSLNRASEIDKRVKKSSRKLAGMILAVKDNIAIQGTPATCGSKFLSNYISPFDATIIQRLQAQDAIIIGKTNMDEFGMGSSTEFSAFGPVKNPFDTTRTSGGSSGGSAAAVAAGMVDAALGTDTGGSIRQPAAFCGIVGLRPTYGRISRYGLIAYSSSLDQIGILSRNIKDCAILLTVMAGADPKDGTSSTRPVDNYMSSLNRDSGELTVGVPEEFFNAGIQEEIRDAIQLAIERMKKSGLKIISVSLPHLDYGVSAYYTIAMAEASSNLARYDGVQYTNTRDKISDLKSFYTEIRSRTFGEEVKRRIMLGAFILSSGYYDAYYMKAQKMRTLIRQDFINVFKNCDVILGPTAPTTAFKLGGLIEDPLKMYLTDVCTVSAPLAGLPAISIPMGTDSQGLPMGLQLTGKAFHEGDLFTLGYWFEHHRN